MIIVQHSTNTEQNMKLYSIKVLSKFHHTQLRSTQAMSDSTTPEDISPILLSLIREPLKVFQLPISKLQNVGNIWKNSPLKKWSMLQDTRNKLINSILTTKLTTRLQSKFMRLTLKTTKEAYNSTSLMFKLTTWKVRKSIPRETLITWTSYSNREQMMLQLQKQELLSSKPKSLL